ncbi:MAG: hypothetical protein L7S48_04975, partial [Candidatus Poseidonia sp.]|nr:hypothetical protein [Poseidonia sp.]
KGAKAAFNWGEDIVSELWEDNVLRYENRQAFREQVAKNGSKPKGDVLAKTFHFWTGGFFLNDD